VEGLYFGLPGSDGQRQGLGTRHGVDVSSDTAIVTVDALENHARRLPSIPNYRYCQVGDPSAPISRNLVERHLVEATEYRTSVRTADVAQKVHDYSDADPV